jgi:DNA adenine methylase
MKPIIKYQGGKRRELATLTALIPPFTGRLIEPFCGGAALAFHLARPAVLRDVNGDLINLYRAVASDAYPALQARVDHLKTLDHDALARAFYEARDAINRPLPPDAAGAPPDLARALSYIVVRQLCFSGMERYNARGEFNVPFGHYRRFSCALARPHHELLRGADLARGDFDEAVASATADDFLFLDPPYLDRLGYAAGDGSGGLHERLRRALAATPARWLLVHSDHPFYRDSYAAAHLHARPFSYAQRFGSDRDHSGAQVQHLYISSHPPPAR